MNRPKANVKTNEPEHKVPPMKNRFTENSFQISIFLIAVGLLAFMSSTSLELLVGPALIMMSLGATILILTFFTGHKTSDEVNSWIESIKTHHKPISVTALTATGIILLAAVT